MKFWDAEHLRDMLARNARHVHEFRWTTEPEGTVWVIAASCVCGEVSWSCTAVDTADLNRELDAAFHSDRLSALGYFTAPTAVPA